MSQDTKQDVKSYTKNKNNNKTPQNNKTSPVMTCYYFLNTNEKSRLIFTFC